MTWISATYYTDFTERYKFDTQDECMEHIKETFNNKKLTTRELYIYTYCGDKDAKTSFLFVCDNTENETKITIYTCLRNDKYDYEYYPPLNEDEHRRKLYIAFEHARLCELNEPDEDDKDDED